MKNNNRTPSGEQGPQQSHGLLNIMKIILLVSVLVGAWFLLDWIING